MPRSFIQVLINLCLSVVGLVEFKSVGLSVVDNSLAAYVKRLDQHLQVATTQNQIEPIVLQDFKLLGEILTGFVCRTGIDMPATTTGDATRSDKGRPTMVNS
jgi:hypothetical protein